MNALLNWLDDRTGYRHLMHEALYEPIPGGSRWRYVWGSTLTFTFFVQVITGVLLWTAYAPSATSAWESVYYIQYVMDMGWMVRGIHHFAAQAMVVLLALHFMQVVVDGAYKAPREVNFWLGLVLMQIVLALSLTGYLLPWDQKGYYATQVATKIMGVTPVVGGDVQRLVQGGSEYGNHTLTRFFAMHAGILPALLVVFLALHIYVFRRHAITPAVAEKSPLFATVLTFLFGPVGMLYANTLAALIMFVITGAAGWWLWQQHLTGAMADTTLLAIAAVGWFVQNAIFCLWARKSAKAFAPDDSHFWPDQVFKDAVACLAVLATVMFLAWYFRGAELTAPADPTEEYLAARPEWYFLFLFRLLKFEAIGQMGEVFGAIVLPGLIMGVIVLMPILGRWKLGHRFNIAFLMALLIAVAILTGIAVREDLYNDEFQAAKANALRDGHRTVVLAQNFGIPPEGAGSLLKDDPLTQGPKIFARNCAACHHYNGHDGTGKKPSDEATAADLGNFGSREWMRGVLVDYKNHFAALKNATWDGANVGDEFLSGDMASWSEDNKKVLTDPANKEALDGIVEFMIAQSGRKDLGTFNDDLVKKGREFYELGEVAQGEITSACMDCHNMTAHGEDTPIMEDGYGPDLTGYAGEVWLRQFIANPEKHYGDKNAMPAFGAKLSTREFDLLTRWMTGNYFQPEGRTEHD